MFGEKQTLIAHKCYRIFDKSSVKDVIQFLMKLNHVPLLSQKWNISTSNRNPHRIGPTVKCIKLSYYTTFIHKTFTTLNFCVIKFS